MVRYNRGKIREFFMKYDWNHMFQEIATLLISVGIGLYLYEKKTLPGMFRALEGMPGRDLFAETSRPYLVFGMVVIAVCLVVKAAIYCSFFDANTLKSGRIGKLRQSGHAVDINGILQEMTTILLGITIGMFTTPAVQNGLLFEKSEYPDLTLGVTLAALCLVVKLFLYAEAVDFKTRAVWQPHRIKPFLGKYDWNEFCQEFGTTCIGIGIGFYLYESRVAFLGEKYFPGFFGRVQDEATGFWGQITDITRGTPLEGTIKLVPDLWSNEAAKPLITAGIAIIAVWAVVKLAIYFSLWDANQLRDALLGQKTKRSRYQVDYNGIADEIATLLLTTLVGLVITPLIEAAFVEEQQGNSRYQIFLLLLLVPVAFFKLLIISGGLVFGPSRKSAGKAGRLKTPRRK